MMTTHTQRIVRASLHVDYKMSRAEYAAHAILIAAFVVAAFLALASLVGIWPL